QVLQNYCLLVTTNFKFEKTNNASSAKITVLNKQEGTRSFTFGRCRRP
ncbi:unnamed protein product, partial [Tenebrio molitor]